MKASELINNSCCGVLLDVPKCELVKQVKILEDENALLKNQLDNAIVELQRRKNGRS
jgi:hypothetical protein